MMQVAGMNPAQLDVSRETYDRLQLMVSELHRWQKIKNLVGPATLAEVWTRHVADSLQLAAAEPVAARWLDLGSGAGFPGLVVAIAITDRPGVHVHLVESNARKCAFLRHIARETAAPVTIHNDRIENVIDSFSGMVEVVTARALAPLSQLLTWTAPLLTSGAVGLFPKGEAVEAELTEAGKSWRFDAEQIPSRSDPSGRILRIRRLSEIDHS